MLSFRPLHRLLLAGFLVVVATRPAASKRPRAERLRFAGEVIAVRPMRPMTMIFLRARPVELPAAGELGLDAPGAKAVAEAAQARAAVNAARRARKPADAIAKLEAAEAAARAKALAALAAARRGAAAELAYGLLLEDEAFATDDGTPDAAAEAYRRGAALVPGEPLGDTLLYCAAFLDESYLGRPEAAAQAYRTLLPRADAELAAELHARLALLALYAGSSAEAVSEAGQVPAGKYRAAATIADVWGRFRRGDCEGVFRAVAVARELAAGDASVSNHLLRDLDALEAYCAADPGSDAGARLAELDPGASLREEDRRAAAEYFATPAAARDRVLHALSTCAETHGGGRLPARTKLTLKGDANAPKLQGDPAELANDLAACARGRLRARAGVKPLFARVEGTVVLEVRLDE